MSIALVAALLTFLVWDAVQPSREAEFETRIETASRRGARLYVPVAVKNLGDEAARMVEVDVRPSGADDAAAARFTIEWLPGRSTRRGIAVFPDSMSHQVLRAEVKGYAAP